MSYEWKFAPHVEEDAGNSVFVSNFNLHGEVNKVPYKDGKPLYDDPEFATAAKKWIRENHPGYPVDERYGWWSYKRWWKEGASVRALLTPFAKAWIEAREVEPRRSGQVAVDELDELLKNIEGLKYATVNKFSSWDARTPIWNGGHLFSSQEFKDFMDTGNRWKGLFGGRAPTTEHHQWYGSKGRETVARMHANVEDFFKKKIDDLKASLKPEMNYGDIVASEGKRYIVGENDELIPTSDNIAGNAEDGYEYVGYQFYPTKGSDDSEFALGYTAGTGTSMDLDVAPEEIMQLDLLEADLLGDGSTLMTDFAGGFWTEEYLSKRFQDTAKFSTTKASFDPRAEPGYSGGPHRVQLEIEMLVPTGWIGVVPTADAEAVTRGAFTDEGTGALVTNDKDTQFYSYKRGVNANGDFSTGATLVNLTNSDKFSAHGDDASGYSLKWDGEYAETDSGRISDSEGFLGESLMSRIRADQNGFVVNHEGSWAYDTGDGWMYDTAGGLGWYYKGEDDNWIFATDSRGDAKGNWLYWDNMPDHPGEVAYYANGSNEWMFNRDGTWITPEGATTTLEASSMAKPTENPDLDIQKELTDAEWLARGNKLPDGWVDANKDGYDDNTLLNRDGSQSLFKEGGPDADTDKSPKKWEKHPVLGDVWYQDKASPDEENWMYVADTGRWMYDAPPGEMEGWVYDDETSRWMFPAERDGEIWYMVEDSPYNRTEDADGKTIPKGPWVHSSQMSKPIGEWEVSYPEEKDEVDPNFEQTNGVDPRLLNYSDEHGNTYKGVYAEDAAYDKAIEFANERKFQDGLPWDRKVMSDVWDGIFKTSDENPGSNPFRFLDDYFGDKDSDAYRLFDKAWNEETKREAVERQASDVIGGAIDAGAPMPTNPLGTVMEQVGQYLEKPYIKDENGNVIPNPKYEKAKDHSIFFEHEGEAKTWSPNWLLPFDMKTQEAGIRASLKDKADERNAMFRDKIPAQIKDEAGNLIANPDAGPNGEYAGMTQVEKRLAIQRAYAEKHGLVNDDPAHDLLTGEINNSVNYLYGGDEDEGSYANLNKNWLDARQYYSDQIGELEGLSNLDKMNKTSAYLEALGDTSDVAKARSRMQEEMGRARIFGGKVNKSDYFDSYLSNPNEPRSRVFTDDLPTDAPNGTLFEKDAAGKLTTTPRYGGDPNATTESELTGGLVSPDTTLIGKRLAAWKKKQQEKTGMPSNNPYLETGTWSTGKYVKP